LKIGERILYVLEKKNIKLSEFASIIDVREHNIEDWKYGNYNPTVAQIIRISDYLNVSTDYLLKGEKRRQ